MRLIIDIPDEQYEYIKKSDKNTFAAVSSKECMLHSIKNGIPVSTEGDLISRSYLKDRLAEHQSILDFEWDNDNLIVSIIDNAPVVTRPQMIGCFNCEHDGKTIKEEPCKYCVHHDKWRHNK